MSSHLGLICRGLAVILLGTPWSGLAQDCPVSTVIRVLDKHSQSVANITADELKAEINGNPAKVSSFSPGPKPRIILLLDASSSMKGDTWNQSIAAAKQLVARAGEGVDIFLFRDKIQNYAIGRSESEKLLDQLSPETPKPGGTALYDALIEIASRVATRNAAMVVMSDGEDNASVHSSDATASLFLRSSWPPVFGLILDYHNSFETRHRYFKKIPAATGGLAAYPQSASEVPIAVEELASAVLNPFALTLQPSRLVTKAAKLKLEVVGAEGKPRNDIDLLHVVEVPGCGSHGPAHR